LSLFKVFIALIICQACSGAHIMKDRSEIKAPFDGERFNNIEPFSDESFWTVLKWRLTRDSSNWEEVSNQKLYKPAVQRSNELRLTMIGHSTVLIQVDNINILTDPHYSQRSSPFSWAGPKRVIAPSIKFEDLPPIDLVLISHNHYDHLDLPTLKKLNDTFSPLFLVGLGNSGLLKQEGIKNTREMDWWDKLIFKNISIHFTPVQHWSARSLFDKRKTLWGGFYVEASKKVFFAGDTGYGKVFKQIYDKYGAMDVGLIPIGAYEPRSFMKNAHINPKEAVKIFQDLKLKKGFGIHFATFNGLTDEAKLKPVTDLKNELEASKVSLEDFIAPRFGPCYVYP